MQRNGWRHVSFSESRVTRQFGRVTGLEILFFLNFTLKFYSEFFSRNLDATFAIVNDTHFSFAFARKTFLLLSDIPATSQPLNFPKTQQTRLLPLSLFSLTNRLLTRIHCERTYSNIQTQRMELRPKSELSIARKYLNGSITVCSDR